MSQESDNRIRRQEILKGLIRQLHQGRSVEEVKAEFAHLLADVGAGEIAAIEQALIAEGLPEMEVKRLCDVHVAVFRESLDQQSAPETTPGHPVHTYRAENRAVEIVLDELSQAMADLAADPAGWERARKLLGVLREYDKHYLRKENMLFPYMEKHGFSGPSSVMWALHDDIRAVWQALQEALAAGPGPDPATAAQGVRDKFTWVATTMRDMIYKEENILFPAALERLASSEWQAIRSQETEIGYALVKPGNEWPGEVGAQAEGAFAPAPADEAPGKALPLDTGALTLEQISQLFAHLPVDVTFVDAEDRVRFFSGGADRIFARTPAVIGRAVQKCHPPHSVQRVQRILDAFRAGQRDEAEFWIQMQGRFIHIRYLAIRNPEGVYQGTLEVVQDVTHIRQLEGERRLLDE